MRVLYSSKVFEQNQLRRAAILGIAYTMKSLGLGVLVYYFQFKSTWFMFWKTENLEIK